MVFMVIMVITPRGHHGHHGQVAMALDVSAVAVFLDCTFRGFIYCEHFAFRLMLFMWKVEVGHFAHTTRGDPFPDLKKKVLLKYQCCCSSKYQNRVQWEKKYAFR